MTRAFSDAFPWGRVQLPGRHSVLALLDKVKDSGVGPDGIPYSAWAAGGEEGAETLKLITWWMMATGSAPESFNESIACFIPKPIDEEAELHCRSPNDVRPLSLKNSDNKICAGILNHGLSKVLPDWAHSKQKGFIPTRNGLDNVVGFDSELRIADWKAKPSDFALGICFDLQAAFPSIAHEFCFASLVILALLGLLSRSPRHCATALLAE